MFLVAWVSGGPPCDSVPVRYKFEVYYQIKVSAWLKRLADDPKEVGQNHGRSRFFVEKVLMENTFFLAVTDGYNIARTKCGSNEMEMEICQFVVIPYYRYVRDTSGF